MLGVCLMRGCWLCRGGCEQVCGESAVSAFKGRAAEGDGQRRCCAACLEVIVLDAWLCFHCDLPVSCGATDALPARVWTLRMHATLSLSAAFAACSSIGLRVRAQVVKFLSFCNWRFSVRIAVLSHGLSTVNAAREMEFMRVSLRVNLCGSVLRTQRLWRCTRRGLQGRCGCQTPCVE